MSEEKRTWTDGFYIRGETDWTEEEHEEDYYFAWFQAQANLKPTEREEKEKISAIREQLDNKIIQRNGLPYGYEAPEPKETKWQKKERRKEENKKKRKLQKKQVRQVPPFMRRK